MRKKPSSKHRDTKFKTLSQRNNKFRKINQRQWLTPTSTKFSTKTKPKISSVTCSTTFQPINQPKTPLSTQKTSWFKKKTSTIQTHTPIHKSTTKNKPNAMNTCSRLRVFNSFYNLLSTVSVKSTTSFRSMINQLDPKRSRFSRISIDMQSACMVSTKSSLKMISKLIWIKSLSSFSSSIFQLIKIIMKSCWKATSILMNCYSKIIQLSPKLYLFLEMIHKKFKEKLKFKSLINPKKQKNPVLVKKRYIICSFQNLVL